MKWFIDLTRPRLATALTFAAPMAAAAFRAVPWRSVAWLSVDGLIAAAVACAVSPTSWGLCLLVAVVTVGVNVLRTMAGGAIAGLWPSWPS